MNAAQEETMKKVKGLLLGAFAVGLAAVPLIGLVRPLPVEAAKSGTCASFAADLNGATYKGDTTQKLSDAQVAGRSVFVHGTFVEFTVNLDTFAVTNYTLTGAPSDKQITNARTIVYTSKAPQLASNLSGDLTLQLQQETILLQRGNGQSIKVTGKDCPQGGIFQMEPQPGTTVVHQLAAGYMYYTDALGRTLFTNGVVIGRESPQLASLVSRTATVSTWSVQAGGRMGAVFGEDATQ
jgi:hypothetical protein